jgi:uncharacterized protein
VTRDELIERVRLAVDRAPEEVVAMYLYGSWARGTARPDSDVDLGFWRRTPSEPRLAAQPHALAVSLEGRVDRDVDLVELNHAPVDLVHEVLRDGIIVLDRDPELRVRFEIRARREYLDMLPVLRRYRRARAAS